MKIIKTLWLWTFTFSMWSGLSANSPRSFTMDCEPATAQAKLAVNKIRAKLTVGGDLWWGNDGYVVPNAFSGERDERLKPVFSSLWVGGFDPGGNLKLAANTLERNVGQTDFYPGPLGQFSGQTSFSECINWDRVFKVKKTEIELHFQHYWKSIKGEPEYTSEMIPIGLKGFPCKGNPFFQEVHGFELPNTGQGLAAFFDENYDGIYNPLDGDFPFIEGWFYKSYGDNANLPDEMLFWIFNDAGGTHTSSNADAIQMEIQMTAFAYDTKDYRDYTTFYNAKLLNRAVEDITSVAFGLGTNVKGIFPGDVALGCDTSRNLSFYYNQFSNGTPIFAIDLFKGPEANVPQTDWRTGEVLIDDFSGDTIFTKEEVGMTSFTYYNNSTLGNPLSETLAPNTGEEFHNYLSGKWRIGKSFEFGGTGYNTGERETRFAFPSSPDCSDDICWSVCSENLELRERTGVMSAGGFTLKPGDVNLISFGTIWIPEEESPCPNLDMLREVDDYIQNWFDENSRITEEVEIWPPDLIWEEEDFKFLGEIKISDEIEPLEFLSFGAPIFVSEEERKYRFEGYQVFQIKDGVPVWSADLNDSTEARLVYQTDIANGIGKIYNWKAMDQPDTRKRLIWTAEEKVKSGSSDLGLKHNFEISTDAFAVGSDRKIRRDKFYYYAVRTYVHNNWKTFDPDAGSGIGSGQKTPFLAGWRKGYKVGKLISFEKTRIAPNPSFLSDDQVQIINLPIRCDVFLFDSTGKLISNWQNTGGDNLAIELSNFKYSLASGVYFFKIKHVEFGEKVLKWIFTK